jgi:hypothetical protein
VTSFSVNLGVVVEAVFWTYLFLFLAINAGFSAIVAYVAKQKGRSASSFFWLSFFLSFLVGILVVLAIPKKDEPLQKSQDSFFVKNSSGEELVKCPFCAEWVKSEAKVCKYCKSDIETAITQYREAEATAKSKEKELLAQEAENQKKLQSENAKKQKQELKKFLSSKVFFWGLGITALVVIGSIVLISISIGEQQQKDQAVQLSEANKEDESQKMLEDWDYALSTCSKEYPSGISESVTALSGDGNLLTIQNSDGANTGFVTCLLRAVVEDQKVIDFYRDKDSQLSN